MELPDVRDFDLRGKTVLLRTDYDVPMKTKNLPAGRQETGGKKQTWLVADETRIEDSLKTIKLLLAREVKVVILAHLGRPGGEFVPELSLGPVAKTLSRLMGKNVPLIQYKDLATLPQKEIVLLENMRFDPREEDKDKSKRRALAKELAKIGDSYIDDAFGTCHRINASIVDLPSFLPHAAGLDLLGEVAFLSSVRKKPRRPVVVLLGGVKRSKLKTVNRLLDWVDLVLIGGKLADYPEVEKLKDHRREVAILTKSGEDVTIESAEKFVDQVKQAGTIIWSGPLGKVEDSRFEKGTKIFAEAMAESKALTVIGGGDTEAVLTRFKVVDRIDYVSSGGGAMLAFFAKGDLPGLKALRKK
jgi:phosphoglycerate kinase